jgi:hypothetical protein
MAIEVVKILRRAYKLHHVYDPTPDELNDALDSLNEMLESWGTNAYLIYVNVKEELTLVVSQGTYTWGSGGDINSARPESIVTMYFQFSGNTQDIYVKPITEPEYDDITDKTVEGRPTKAFLAPEFPLAKLYLYPVPNAADTLKLTSRKPFSTLAMTDSLTLPPGYSKAIIYNLAVDLMPFIGVVADPVIVSEAAKSLNAVINKNAKPLKMVSDVPRSRRNKYKRPFNIDILE